MDKQPKKNTVCIVQDTDMVDCRGNLLLDRVVASKIILVPPLSYTGGPGYGKDMKGLKHKMEDYKQKLE